MKRIVLLGLLFNLFLIWGCNGGNSDIIISGTVEVKEIRISSEVPGKILEIGVSEGDSVNPSQVLALIDDSQYRIKLSAAEVQQAQIETLLKDAESDLRKAKNLYQNSSIPKETYEKAELQVKIHGLKLKEIKENIKLLKLYIEKSKILAPISGDIYEVYFEPGEVISPGIPIFLLHNRDDLYIKTYIPEQHLGQISLNEEVDLKIDSFPEKRFKGKITFISEKAEFTPSTLQTEDQRVVQVYEVRIELLEQKELFKPGMFTTVIIKKKFNETDHN